ncbi:MAG: recombination-associated protein RdgC [Burkholderiales bacterium]|nr:recombination-associated protein RdgC [Burkholderiales bacterium]
MWFRNLIIYSVPRGWDLAPEALAALLAPQAFAPGTSREESTIGWVPPREGDDSLVFTINQQMLLTLRQEKKLLPAKVVTQVLKQRAEQIEAEDGFKPGRKRLKELKEQIRDELLPRAFSLASDMRVWIDPVGGWLVIDSTSAARAGEVFSLLVKAIDRLPARPLKVAGSVAGEMTAWLSTGEAPAGFTVDQDAELRARDGKATVRFANQSMDLEDVARHTRAGKQCTRLALTWADRISFVLTDKLEIKRVRALDVLKEAAASAEGDAAERFASDAMLMTGELSKLLAEVVDCLGGQPV